MFPGYLAGTNKYLAHDRKRSLTDPGNRASVCEFGGLVPTGQASPDFTLRLL